MHSPIIAIHLISYYEKHYPDLLLAISAAIFLVACKKDDDSAKISFKNNVAEGTANANGEYTITGHISSPVRLDRVTLTREGQASSFYNDSTTAKNKQEP